MSIEKAPARTWIRWGGEGDPTWYVRADLAERYRDALRELLAASEAIDVDTWTKPAITQRLADAEDAARAVLAASEDGDGGQA